MEKRICFLTVLATASALYFTPEMTAAPPSPDWVIEIRIEPKFPEGFFAPVTPRLAPEDSHEQAHIGLFSTNDPNLFRIAPLLKGLEEPPEYLALVYEAGSFAPVRDNIVGFEFKTESERSVARVVAHPRFEPSSELPYIVGLQQSLAGKGETLTLDFGLNNPTTSSISIVGLDLKAKAYRGACFTIYSKIKLQVDVKGNVVSGQADIENSSFSRRKKLKGYVTNCGSMGVGLESRIEVPAKRQIDLELSFSGTSADQIREYEWWGIWVSLDVRGKRLTLTDSINTERILNILGQSRSTKDN